MPLLLMIPPKMSLSLVAAIGAQQRVVRQLVREYLIVDSMIADNGKK